MNDDTTHDAGPKGASEATSPCWRCGLEVAAVAEVCPHCAARQRTAAAHPLDALAGGSRPVRDFSSSAALKTLFWSYGVLLITGIIHALVMQFTVDADGPLDAATRTRIYTQILFVEGIDSAIILGVLLFAARPAPPPIPGTTTRIVTWVLVLPVLGGLLGLNLGYHWLLRQVLQVPLITDELTVQIDSLAIIAMCVQPAVIEELYCRYYALDCLREFTGPHVAVWISAVMFGFMHVAMLPSIPYLIIMGVVLGYMRLASGTLLVPMLIHFVHNLAITLMD